MRKTIFFSALLVILLALYLLVFGCNSSGHIDVPNSIPAVGSAVDKASSHIESADKLVNAAKPESNQTGKKLLDIASTEHGSALEELETAKIALSASEAERSTVIKKYNITFDELTAIKVSWGHRLQIWVTRFFWILVGLLAFHFIAGGAALFVPGPIGLGLALASKVVNPAGWFDSIRDNIWFRRQAKNVAPAPTAALA